MMTMIALLRSRAAPYIAAGLCIALWLASYARQQREIGRAQVLLAASDSAQAAVTLALAAAQRQVARDSASAARLARAADAASQRAVAAESRLSAALASYQVTRAALDTALVTVPIPARAAVTTFRAASDSVVHACIDARQTLQRALDACQVHGDALAAELVSARGVIGALAADTTAQRQAIMALRSTRPSAAGRWLDRAGWLVAAAAVVALIARR
jgi:hypothetical protein